MAKVHPIIAAITKHRGPIIATVPLVDSLMFVQVVKTDLLRVLTKDPAKCDEMTITGSGELGLMYIERKF